MISLVAGALILSPVSTVLVVGKPDARNTHQQWWSLPKGHHEPEESLIATAEREAKEESGITELEYRAPLGMYVRSKYVGTPPGSDEQKEVHLFLFTISREVQGRPEMEGCQVRWVPLTDVPAFLSHPKDGQFIERVITDGTLKEYI